MHHTLPVNIQYCVQDLRREGKGERIGAQLYSPHNVCSHLLKEVHDDVPLAFVCALQPLSQAILAAELHLNEQVGWRFCWLHKICEGDVCLKLNVR